MKLLVVGCSFRNTPLELRERLAFDNTLLARALTELNTRYACEAVILSTCNRIELYLARTETALAPDFELIAEFLCEVHGIAIEQLRPFLYGHANVEAVGHLFRVVCSLDSLVVGEAQISGQVRRAYEEARRVGSVGPALHALFQHAARVAGRVRSETGISQGHASVSSVAVDYVRQVFEHFGDKTILVIGAGKMGELTLRHLRQLWPKRILVTNRSPEKAHMVAAGCGGVAIPWEKLDEALAQADIILSTTGAPEPIVSLERYQRARAHRAGSPAVILDIAVPRDFDPRIHDGEQNCLFNIDDLQLMREQTLRSRRKHIQAAEAIIKEEQKRFWREWTRRRNGPLIARLTADFETKRKAILEPLLSKLNGRLTDEDRALIEGAFRLLQNQILHGPISALTEEVTQEGGGHSLREALRKMFRLGE